MHAAGVVLILPVARHLIMMRHCDSSVCKYHSTLNMRTHTSVPISHAFRVIFELIWRDFFRFFAAKHEDRIFYESGPIGGSRTICFCAHELCVHRTCCAASAVQLCINALLLAALQLMKVWTACFSSHRQEAALDQGLQTLRAMG